MLSEEPLVIECLHDRRGAAHQHAHLLLSAWVEKGIKECLHEPSPHRRGASGKPQPDHHHWHEHGTCFRLGGWA